MFRWLSPTALALVLLPVACSTESSDLSDASRSTPRTDGTDRDGGGEQHGGGEQDAAAADAPVSDAGPDSRDAGTPDASGMAVARCTEHRFIHDGVPRGYILCQPEPVPARPMPVLLGFHGGGGRARNWRRSVPLENEVAASGFVVVYVQGCRAGLDDCADPLGTYVWNVDKPGSASTVDDDGYTVATVNRLEAVHGLSIDRTRVYAAGHSMGGILIYSLLCDRPNLFRAVVPISSPPSDGSCQPEGQASIHHVHGARDPNVPYATGCCSRLQKTIGQASYLAECEALPECANPLNWWPPVRSGKHPFAAVAGLDAIAEIVTSCRPEPLTPGDRRECGLGSGCSSGQTLEVCLLPGVGHGLAGISDSLDLPRFLIDRFGLR